MKTNKFFTKNKILYILFLIIIVVLIYTYKSYENFIDTPICTTRAIPCDKTFDIIICIGQSNMIGQTISNTVDTTYLTDDNYIGDLNYTIDPKVYKVIFNIDKPNDVNICQSQESNKQFSMVTSLGREYVRRKPNKNVLIINIAKSSTGIIKSANRNSDHIWQVTDVPAPNKKKALYPIARDFINLVKSKICSTSKVVAICYQGSEEDSYSSAPCATAYDTEYIEIYNRKMFDLLNAFKTNIGDRNTKILVGGLLLDTSHPCSEYFTNNVLKEVARRNGYIFVSTDANTSSSARDIKYLRRRLNGSGGVHFNKISYIELGKRFAYNLSI